ncbi:uncharacterized protein LOC144294995 [Canis aureus]
MDIYHSRESRNTGLGALANSNQPGILSQLSNLGGFSAAVIWERSQLSTMGEEIGYFSISDWSSGTYPGKQGGQQQILSQATRRYFPFTLTPEKYLSDTKVQGMKTKILTTMAKQGQLRPYVDEIFRMLLPISYMYV